jgi:hypothetical protein
LIWNIQYIYYYKLKKQKTMGGCGCKNKNNGNQVPQPQTAQPVQNNTQNSPTIQESIKKVVEKYYKKR